MLSGNDDDTPPRKYYGDGGEERIVSEQLYDLDWDQKLRLSKLVDYTREQVRTLYRSSVEVQERWVDTEGRSQLLDLLADRNIEIDELRDVTGLPDVDPFDLICHIAFDEPALTYKQRAERLRRRNPDIFVKYGADAKVILDTLLNKYAEHGADELDVQTTFKANFPQYNVLEIADKFGGVDELRTVMEDLQNQLYSA